MFGFFQKFNPSKFDTLIGENTVITKGVAYCGNINIKGRVFGDVVPASTPEKGIFGVIVESFVQGNITGDYVVISGQVFGEVIAKSVIITKTGLVNGNITYDEIVLNKGCVINGLVTKSVEGYGAKES